jgi:hypothetical protein
MVDQGWWRSTLSMASRLDKPKDCPDQTKMNRSRTFADT